MLLSTKVTQRHFWQRSHQKCNLKVWQAILFRLCALPGARHPMDVCSAPTGAETSTAAYGQGKCHGFAQAFSRHLLVNRTTASEIPYPSLPPDIHGLSPLYPLPIRETVLSSQPASHINALRIVIPTNTIAISLKKTK